MPLTFRPALLPLFAALLGVAGMAVGAPQQHPHRGARASLPESDQAAPRPLQDRPDWTRQAPRRNEDALSDSVRRVEQRTRGQVLSAERVPYDGRNLNRIKVVDERGRVRVYMDDPQAGQPQDGAPTRDNDD